MCYSSSFASFYRRNLPSFQYFKTVPAFFLRSQNSAVAPSQRNETSSRNREVRPFEDIPGPRRSLRSIVEFYWKTEGFTKLYKMHDDMFAKYGPIYKEELMLGRPTVHLMDPSDFEKVFRADGKYPKRPDLFDFWREHRRRRNFSLGIFLSDDQEWYKLRHSISPKIMRPKIVEENIDNFKAVTDDAIARFVKLNEACGPNDHIPDLEGELSKWSTESMGTFTFDIRLGLYEDPPNKEGVNFIQTVTEFHKVSHRLAANPAERVAFQYFDTPTFKKYLKIADDLLETGQDLVNQKLRELAQMSKKETDSSDEPQVVSLLTYMLTKKELSPEEINGMAFDMIMNGVDTTSFSVLWTLYHLGRYPHIQDKVYQEVDSVVGKDGDVTTRHLAKMSYLKAFFRETQRLTPVIGTNIRMLDQDVVLSGYKVPAQTFLFLEEYCAARSENYFKEPLEFKPERWLRENKDDMHPFSRQPFGFGTRMCVGRRVAELQMHVFLCKFLQRFQVESCHQEPLEPYQKLVTVPDKPVKLRLLDRL